MPRPKMPKQKIADYLKVKRFVWMEGQRVYIRKDGQFIPSGWTGTLQTTWAYGGKKIPFIVLDRDL